MVGAVCSSIVPSPPPPPLAPPKVELSREALASLDRRLMFNRASLTPAPTVKTQASCSSVVPKSRSKSPSVPSAIPQIVLLRHIEKLVLMDRAGTFPARPIDEIRVPNTVFLNVELSEAALRNCIRASPYKDTIMRHEFYIFTLESRKKRALVASNFSSRNFPQTATEINGICFEKVVILCNSHLDAD